MQRFLIYFLFCLSGAVALVYESLWSRYLKLFLGHSSYGQIVTLIVFMGGLGVGSFIAAKYLPKIKHPFLAYARIELIAALFGLGFHPAYEALSGWFFNRAAGLQEMSPLVASVVQISLCLLLTLPFATLLGMTFPLLAAGMIRSFRDGGRGSLPMLYFGNSLGGAIGILLCSYWLVSAFGTHGSLQLAALGNVIVGGGFYLLHKRGLTGAPQEEMTRAEKTKVPASPLTTPANPRIALWLTIAAGTGLASFIYEVGWIRLLSLILGSSTHSFDAMISAFILGLAFGGLFVRRILHRCTGDLAPVLGIIQVLMGSFAALSLYLYRPFFDAVQSSHGIFAKTEAAFPLYSVYKYLICLAMMFPAAFCAGMTLPIITWRLVRDTGRDSFTGLVYGWNTIGSIIGAALAGMVLIPLLQLKWTIFAGAALDILLGLVLLAVSFKMPAGGLAWKPIALRVGAVAVVAAALLPAFWTGFNPSVLASGSFRQASLAAGKLPEIVEINHGRTATISVGKSGDIRYIATNGKSDGALYMGTTEKAISKVGDETTVAQLAVLPMMTRRGEYDAAVIGMGTGMTGHYLLGDHRLKSLDLIEIEGAVVKLARHFQPRNDRIWSDPRLNLVIDDAKRHFYTNRKQYDVIISEPSNPWVSGVAGLFTKEFYSHLQHFLKPGGVLVQWVHGYEFRDELLVSIFSALDTFAHFEIYRVSQNGGDYIVIAGDSPSDFITADELAANSVLREEFEKLGGNLESFGPGNFIASSVTLRPILDQYAALANSDYYPYVEQHAETSFYTSARVQLPTALLHPFSTYADVLEPERMQEARARRISGPTPVMEARHLPMFKQARGLLALPDAEADWEGIEKMYIAATENSAGLPAWSGEPIVQRMREVVAEGKVEKGVAKRFALLDAICKGDESAMRTALPEAMKESSPGIKADPFWVRTFLITSLRLGMTEERDLAMREGVNRCAQLKADERTLIHGIVEASRLATAGPSLVRAAEPDEEKESE
jgi:spermidine synthase